MENALPEILIGPEIPTSPAKESEGFKVKSVQKPDRSNLSDRSDIHQKHKARLVQEVELVEDQRRCKSPTGQTRSVQEKSKATFEDFICGCVHIFHPL